MHKYDTMTEKELQDHLSHVAQEIKEILPEDTGFFLCVSPFGPNNVAQYISNVTRDTGIKWLGEIFVRLSTQDSVDR